MIVFLVFFQSDGEGSLFSGCHFVFSFIRHSVSLLNINIGDLVLRMLDYESDFLPGLISRQGSGNPSLNLPGFCIILDRKSDP